MGSLNRTVSSISLAPVELKMRYRNIRIGFFMLGKFGIDGQSRDFIFVLLRKVIFTFEKFCINDLDRNFIYML